MVLLQGLGFLMWPGAIAVIYWACTDSQFRDAEGFLKGRFCLPLSIGVALLVLSWSMAKEEWRKFGLWFALALVGQTVALQVIDAGRSLHYQHYKLLEASNQFLFVFFLVQTCIVAIGLWSRWRIIWDWIRRNFKTWQLVAIGFVFLLSSAAPSREIGFYIAELSFAALVQAVNLGNIVLMVWALPQEALTNLQRRFDRWFGPTEDADRGPRVEGRGSVDRFALLAAIWVTTLAAMLNFLVYERHPHVQDEVVYLYHARYFASGLLSMPAPPVAEAFEMYLMEIDNNRWYPVPPHGWPLVLALGVALGAPWLVNPVLAGVNLLFAFVLVKELYNYRSARLVVFLLSLSPWYVFMAMSFMPHTFTLTCMLIGAAMIIRARKKSRAIGAWLSGAAAGMASLIRPLDGVIVGGILGLLVLSARKFKIPAIGAFVLGCVLIGATVFPYNEALTGDPMIFPIIAYTDKLFGPKSNAIGFGPDRGLGWPLDPFPGHGPLDAIVNAQLNLFSVNVELFGWSTGSLLLMAILVFSGAMQRSDYLMGFVVAAVVGAYSLYWYSGGPDFGARYWYLIIVPCVALTVSGVQFLEKALAGGSGTKPAYVMVAVLTLSLLAVVNYFPWRAIDKYHHYLQMRADIRYLASKYNFGKSIVLIRGNDFPDYVSAAAYNPVDFSASVPLYAWDRSPDVRARVLKAYPDRKVWIVEGPSLTGNGYEVVAGPQSSAQVR